MNTKRYIAYILEASGCLFRWLPERICVSSLSTIAWMLAAGRGPKAGLRLLLELNNKIYSLTGKLACDYGMGLHPKHRLMRYHDFFVNRLTPGETVIDIGCGKGALTQDMAMLGGVKVTGIELSESSFLEAKQKYGHDRVRYVHGNVLKDLPDESFDAAVMSNVLEHLENRVDFLKEAQLRLKPKRWLIRVPLYERDWRVPLMDELGIDYRLDHTHYIEYTQEQFVQELDQAGLEIIYQETRWGEIWCEAIATEGKKGDAILRSES